MKDIIDNTARPHLDVEAEIILFTDVENKKAEGAEEKEEVWSKDVKHPIVQDE